MQLRDYQKQQEIIPLQSGLAINIASFSNLLKRVDFDVIVDHLALLTSLKVKKNQPPPD